MAAPAPSPIPLADKRAEAARMQAQLEEQGAKVSVLADWSNRAQLKVAEVGGPCP